MNKDVSKILGWVLPIGCVLIAGAVLFFQHKRLDEAQVQLRSAEDAAIKAAMERDSALRDGQDLRFAAAEKTPIEESQFLNDLRVRAAASGVKLLRWNSRAIEFGGESNSSTTTEEKEKQDKLKGIIKIASDLTLAGPYANARRFVGGLTSSERLYTLGNVRWARTEKGTELLLTISRYIQPNQGMMSALDDQGSGVTR
jgi:hypothetical protein